MSDDKRGTTHYLFTTMTPEEFRNRPPGFHDRAWYSNSPLARARLTFRAPVGWSLSPDRTYGVVLKNVYGAPRPAIVALGMLGAGNAWRNHLDELVEVGP